LLLLDEDELLKSTLQRIFNSNACQNVISGKLNSAGARSFHNHLTGKANKQAKNIASNIDLIIPKNISMMFNFELLLIGLSRHR